MTVIGILSFLLLVAHFVWPMFAHPALFWIALGGIAFDVFKYFEARKERKKFNNRFDRFGSRFK